MKFLPTSDADRAEMLAAIGVSGVDDLFASIPASVRQAPQLPPPLSEIELRRLFGGLAKRNANAVSERSPPDSREIRFTRFRPGLASISMPLESG